GVPEKVPSVGYADASALGGEVLGLATAVAARVRRSRMARLPRSSARDPSPDLNPPLAPPIRLSSSQASCSGSTPASISPACSSSLEPKWANRPLLLMPRSLARRCRETASRPSAEPTLAAWSRIACLVRIPRCRRRSVVASSAMLCRNISTTGRILLTLHDRSCYFFLRWNFDPDRIRKRAPSRAGGARAVGRSTRRPAVRPPLQRDELPAFLQP